MRERKKKNVLRKNPLESLALIKVDNKNKNIGITPNTSQPSSVRK